jgi:virulence factor Mce-like protein
MIATLRRYTPFMVVGLLVVLLAALFSIPFVHHSASKTIRAEFTAAPGLYVGNKVDVLGIPVGTVSAIKPGPEYVMVTMAVRKDLPIPANATATIIAPEVVSDRAVQLSSYNGGPTLAAGTTISLASTAIPVSVDVVVGQLNRLAEDLGPNGANKTGALTNLLAAVAKQFAGNGPDFHSAVVNLSQLFQGLAQTSPQLASLLENLGSLNSSLANNAGTYATFTNDLNSVTSLLASDHTEIGAVLSDLQQLLGNLTSFINTNGTALGTGITNLQQFAATLTNEQGALAKVFQLTPLTIQNLNNAIDPNAPGGPALRARFDPLPDTSQAFSQVCGNAVLRFLVVLATGTQKNPLTTATPMDTVCALGNALTALTPPPGSAAGPDLSLQALVGG